MSTPTEAGIRVSTGNPVRRLALLGLGFAQALSFLAPLLTRLVIGSAFFLTGRGKLENFERTVGFFTELGIPFPWANAAFVSSLEMVGGICLMLGLGTRIISLLLSGSMVVALLTADREGFVKNFPLNLTDVVPVVYGMFLLWLILAGPGWLSLDHWIGKKLRLTDTSDNKIV